MDSLTSYVHDAIIELGIESIGRDTKWEIADHTQLEPHQVQHGLDCGAMDRVFANEAEDDDYQYPELGEEKVYDHQCGDM